MSPHLISEYKFLDGSIPWVQIDLGDGTLGCIPTASLPSGRKVGDHLSRQETMRIFPEHFIQLPWPTPEALGVGSSQFRPAHQPSCSSIHESSQLDIPPQTSTQTFASQLLSSQAPMNKAETQAETGIRNEMDRLSVASAGDNAVDSGTATPPNLMTLGVSSSQALKKSTKTQKKNANRRKRNKAKKDKSEDEDEDEGDDKMWPDGTTLLPRLKYATMDPFLSLGGVSFNDLDKIDVTSDISDDGRYPEPYYVKVFHFNMNNPLIPGVTLWHGEFRCIQEANDIALIVAVDHYRTLYNEHYGVVDEHKPVLCITETPQHPDSGMLQFQHTDPGKNFFLVVKATVEEPGEEYDVSDEHVTHQSWYVYHIQLIVTGSSRKGLIGVRSPITKNKFSISRQNANKYAAKMFVEAIKDLLPTPKVKAHFEAIKKVTVDLEKKIVKWADHSPDWSFERTLTSVKSFKDEDGNMVKVDRHVKVAVHRFETDP